MFLKYGLLIMYAGIIKSSFANPSYDESQCKVIFCCPVMSIEFGKTLQRGRICTQTMVTIRCL